MRRPLRLCLSASHAASPLSLPALPPLLWLCTSTSCLLPLGTIKKTFQNPSQVSLQLLIASFSVAQSSETHSCSYAKGLSMARSIPEKALAGDVLCSSMLIQSKEGNLIHWTFSYWSHHVQSCRTDYLSQVGVSGLCLGSGNPLHGRCGIVTHAWQAVECS